MAKNMEKAFPGLIAELTLNMVENDGDGSDDVSEVKIDIGKW